MPKNRALAKAACDVCDAKRAVRRRAGVLLCTGCYRAVVPARKRRRVSWDFFWVYLSGAVSFAVLPCFLALPGLQLLSGAFCLAFCVALYHRVATDLRGPRQLGPYHYPPTPRRPDLRRIKAPRSAPAAIAAPARPFSCLSGSQRVFEAFLTAHPLPPPNPAHMEPHKK